MRSAPLLAFIVGCASPVVVQRTGVRYSALPGNCPVDYVASTSDFNAADYQQLGYLSLRQNGFTEQAKAELLPKVCELRETMRWIAG